MLTNWRYLLVGAAIVFVIFLLVQMRPALPLPAMDSSKLRAARDRVREATSPRAKAEALCEAGEIAAHAASKFRAAGYFMRAMRADPAWPGAIERAALAFHRRPRLLERVLWRQLAELPWDEEHRDAARAAAYALRDLYDRRLRDRIKAD